MENKYENLLDEFYDLVGLAGSLGGSYLKPEEVSQANQIFHYITRRE